jgi:Ca-activated chloride channel family protein
MTLAYEQVLAPSGGMLRYHYVLSTERYASRPLDEVSVTVDVHSAAGLGSLYAPAYPVTTERLGQGRARVTWSAEDVTPHEDFELFFGPAEGGFGSGLLTGEREGQGHLLFLFAPGDQAEREPALPKDIVFVIDRSGSMQGEKIAQAQNALRFILAQLNPDDRFSIVGFDDQLVLLSETLLGVDRAALADARGFVDRLSADGNTDLEAALQAGLGILDRSEARAGASRMVVFLTDGLPTAGITDEVQIASRVAQTNEGVGARLHVFGVGYDVNTHLLDRLAENNGGTVTYVQPDESLELALSGFYDRIANPVLTDVEVTFEGLEVEEGTRYPARMPDLFRGSSVLLTARYRAAGAGDAVTVRVRGRAGAARREYVYHFDLADAAGHDFVPRLWATRRVGELLDRVRVEGERPALVDEIRELGLGYGLVTPYTTFVIAAQSEGAASAENMALYEDQRSLNRASGRTTIRARVQNQSYQQAEQASLASGANVVNYGERSLAQVAQQQVDLSLVRGRGRVDGPVDAAWIARNVTVDREVTFGSEAYFALAEDPAARPFLQSGTQVLFSYEGEVVAVRDPQAPDPAPEAAGPAQGLAPRRTGFARLWEVVVRFLRWVGL